MQSTIIRQLFFLLCLSVLTCSCNKLVQVPEPVNTVTSSETFSNDGNATAAVVGIYQEIASGHGYGMDFSNGFTSFLGGVSADELKYFQSNSAFAQWQDNAMQSSNPYLEPYFWTSVYNDVYIANAVVQGLQTGTGVTPSLSSELIGEAEFLRAYCYFHLVNLFGDVPLVLTTAWAQTDVLPAAPSAQVYAQILADLRDAQSRLPADYSVAVGQRIRANKWAATALLARVYLYLGNWTGADSAASAVIGNTGLFGLTGLDSVFLANSQESIWQIQPITTSQFAVTEANKNLPFPLNTGIPQFILTPQLLAAFDSGDLRRTHWVDSTKYGGVISYFPFKYKIKTATSSNQQEYYTMLRLGEQFLIRAEADMHGAGADVSGAINDLNVIRARANLPAYSGGTDSASVFTALIHERQIELFGEKGARWMDLKRWGLAGAILGTISYKQPWNNKDLLWPYPVSEVAKDPDLQQHPGY
jgi:hypothetical protein